MKIKDFHLFPFRLFAAEHSSATLRPRLAVSQIMWKAFVEFTFENRFAWFITSRDSRKQIKSDKFDSTAAEGAQTHARRTHSTARTEGKKPKRTESGKARSEKRTDEEWMCSSADASSDAHISSFASNYPPDLL